MATNPSPVSSEALEAVTRALRHRGDPARLRHSPWLSSCLVTQLLRENPDLLPHQALAQIFDDVWLHLRQESADEADLLKTLFWKREITVSELARRVRHEQGIAESTFYSQYREARIHFALLLIQKEDRCRENLSSVETLAGETPRDDAPEVTGRRPRRIRSWPSLLLIWGVIVGVLAGLFVIVVLRRSPSGGEVPVALASPLPSATVTPTAVHEVVPEPTPSTVCGERTRRQTPPRNRFVRTQGVSLFSRENTDGALLDDAVRSLAMDERGLWIGYFPAPGGVGHYDGQTWADCTAEAGFPVERVNALVIDGEGRVWAGMERLGVALYDGTGWQRYTTANGLPSDGIFGMTVDGEGRVWAATWEGIARFDGDRWSVPYSVYNGTLINNHTHAIAFDGAGNVWIGYVNRGVSRFSSAQGTWIHYSREGGQIGGDELRDILVRPAGDIHPESVWFATADGGVTRYEQETWTVYGAAEGLPSASVTDLALDRYGRVWAATEGGVAYFDGDAWRTYTTLRSQAVALGPACVDCPFDDDDVWTGATGSGLTHSGLPLPGAVIDVVRVVVPAFVAPGEPFRPEVTVAPRAPYRLGPGDFLAHIDPLDEQRFGAYPHIAVTEVVEPGQPFTFTDYDNPFTAPELSDGENEQTYTSTWRVWMDNRYVGSSIPITFTVRRGD